MGIKLHDLGLSNSFLDIIPKAQAIKEKLDKLDLNLHFCPSKDIKKVKRQAVN